VTCNQGLRLALESACRKNGLRLRLAARNLCTDNAAMIGILAGRKLLKGAADLATGLDLEPEPGWALA
jgi:N6-L-threonylcarbamoyladenine synthase